MNINEINALHQFQVNLNLDIFKEIFGATGEHLWEKYEGKPFEGNLLTFLSTHALSQENLEKFLAYMNQHISE